MPTLLETIGDYDEDLLLMIAAQWGIETEDIATKKLARHIAESISGGDLKDFLASITENDLGALRDLSGNKGRIPWPQFVRKYSELREMGAARRQRERPDTQPASQTESLYYKGLIGKAFFDARGGPREFAFIPDEVLIFFTPGDKSTFFDNLSHLPDKQIQKKWIANDYILDHASTALAALRTGIALEEVSFRRPEITGELLLILLQDAGLISRAQEIIVEQVRSFLEANRGRALFSLYEAWKESERFNELDLIPGIEFEKPAANDPHIARSLLIDLIDSLPDKGWFSLDEFIDKLHELQPDILRKAGEYDAWFVKDKQTGNNISGFEEWHAIEGEYLRAMINGPLFWFGLLDLGKTAGGKVCFCRSQWADALLDGEAPEYQTIETHDLTLDKTGRIIIDRYFPRDIRYQIARFCEWGSQKGNRYEYRITPSSLLRMDSQGLTVKQMLSLLRKYARKPMPGNIINALEHWEKHGLEAELRSEILLRVKSSGIMDALMASPAKGYIRERLNAECALVARKGIPFINAALLELGYFAEIEDFEKSPRINTDKQDQ